MPAPGQGAEQRSKIKTILPLLVGMSFIPGLLSVSFFVEDANPGDILMSSSIYIIFYPPLLAFTAAFCGHFRPRHAIYPILLMPAVDIIFEPLLDLAFRGFFPQVTPDVLGKSVLVALGPLVAVLAMIHRATLFRFMAAGLCLAQCCALLLFHEVAVSSPMRGMVEQERIVISAHVERDGTPEGMCSLRGVRCMRGTPEEVAGWAEQPLRDPGQARSLLHDTAQRPDLLFTWIENPTPADLHTVSLVTAMKFSEDDVLLLVNTAGPTALYQRHMVSLGTLIAVFHQVWVILALAILGRHGAYSFIRWRWRRDG